MGAPRTECVLGSVEIKHFADAVAAMGLILKGQFASRPLPNPLRDSAGLLSFGYGGKRNRGGVGIVHFHGWKNPTPYRKAAALAAAAREPVIAAAEPAPAAAPAVEARQAKPAAPAEAAAEAVQSKPAVSAAPAEAADGSAAAAAQVGHAEPAKPAASSETAVGSATAVAEVKAAAAAPLAVESSAADTLAPRVASSVAQAGLATLGAEGEAPLGKRTTTAVAEPNVVAAPLVVPVAATKAGASPNGGVGVAGYLGEGRVGWTIFRNSKGEQKRP